MRHLSGYKKIKRHIEKTILLVLTHGDIYDRKNKCKKSDQIGLHVLFEKPSGCGKTISSKIILQYRMKFVYFKCL